MSLEKYQEWLKLNDCSDKTVSMYIYNIKKLLLKVDDLTENNINNYVIDLQKKFKPNGINIHLTAISSYLKYLKIDNIRLPKKMKTTFVIKEAISEEYLLNEIFPGIDDLFENKLKVKLVFALLFYTGGRINEILSIKREDIDLKNKRIIIYQTKTRQEITIFLSKSVKSLLEYYLNNTEYNEWLFDISYSAITRYMKVLNDNLNCSPKLHSHLFRHSMAVRMKKRGMSVYSIMKLLGHKNIQTTMRYLHSFTIDDLQKEFDKFV